MPISFACSCGKTLIAKDAFAGKRMKCPKCSNIIHIPGGDAPPPPKEVVRRVRPSTLELPRPELGAARDPEVKPALRLSTDPEVSLPPRRRKAPRSKPEPTHPWFDRSLTPLATPWREGDEARFQKGKSRG